MKEYVRDLLNGWVYLEVQLGHHAEMKIRFPKDYSLPPFFPFEGCDGTVFEETKESLNEEYHFISDCSDYSLQINDLPDEEGKLAILTCPDHTKRYHYSEKPFNKRTLEPSEYGEDIGRKILELNQKGTPLAGFGRARIKPVIYKLEDGWLIFSFHELVRGRSTSHVGVIAKTPGKANFIMNQLFGKIGETPYDRLSRWELFVDIGIRRDYNDSPEANQLRYYYLKKIKRAEENLDFSELYNDLAEDCSWGGGHTKSETIKYLSSHAAERKRRKLWCKCTIVQIGDPVPPMEFNTSSDGTGAKVFLLSNHSEGEYCMIEETSFRPSFLRMELSPDGKIYNYYDTYDTIPMGPYHPVESEN